MIERRLVHRRFLVDVDRLHEIDLDLGRPGAQREDVLVDVLALAAVIPGHRDAQGVDPQAAQPFLVGAADGDLLKAQDAERSRAHEWLLSGCFRWINCRQQGGARRRSRRMSPTWHRRKLGPARPSGEKPA